MTDLQAFQTDFKINTSSDHKVIKNTLNQIKNDESD